MIGRRRDPQGGLGVPDRLVESAELGEHDGELGRRARRLDAGGAEALVAQVALESDVPLEQGGRVAELAAGGVRHAQEVRCDYLDRAIAEGWRDAQGFPAESDGHVVLAS